jgi:hypothetical protein
MIEITATAYTKEDKQGYRSWDMSWVDSYGDKRGSVATTTVARLQRTYDELTYMPLNVRYNIVIPKHLV